MDHLFAWYIFSEISVPMQIFDQNATLMIINFHFFLQYLKCYGTYTDALFCVICTFGIDFLPKSERHRIDDETMWTTATFYVLKFFVVVRKKIFIIIDISGRSWIKCFPRLGYDLKIECASLIWHQNDHLRIITYRYQDFYTWYLYNLYCWSYFK